jgi:uncharacterized protein YycO
MSEYTPVIGQFGVVKTNGVFGKLIRVGTLSRWNHAFIYIGNGQIVEANPKGVEISDASKYPTIAWNKHQELSESERETIAKAAVAAVGKEYSFLTIALLALRILGVRIFSNSWVIARLAMKEGYICSELVAECYDKAGVVIANKRDYLTVPGDLAEVLVYQ